MLEINSLPECSQMIDGSSGTPVLLNDNNYFIL